MANINSLSLLCEYKKTRRRWWRKKIVTNSEKDFIRWWARCESSECFSQTENAVCAVVEISLCKTWKCEWMKKYEREREGKNIVVKHSLSHFVWLLFFFGFGHKIYSFSFDSSTWPSLCLTMHFFYLIRASEFFDLKWYPQTIVMEF